MANRRIGYLLSCLVAVCLVGQPTRSPAQGVGEPRELETAPGDDAVPRGDAVLRSGKGEREIVVTTTERLAGAIHSLTWGGREFIDSADHGRQLQSAASFDCAAGGPFWAEQYNPTEAGARADGAGGTSTSRLLRLSVEQGELRTTTQMAFWLAPGERSEGRPALNGKRLSDHLVSKRVRIGYKALPQLLDYEVTFVVPEGERHFFAQFESLTGYMPADFSRFYRLSDKSAELEPLDDGPGEQDRPIVMSTESGGHAMGIFSPDQPSPGFQQAGYGRFRFPAEKVVKWNCVFREQNKQGIAPGARRFRQFVAVGTLDEVRQTIAALEARTRASRRQPDAQSAGE